MNNNPINNNDYQGIIEDPRSQKEKDQDFIHEELFATAYNPTWTERAPRTFPIRNQDGSGSCVAFATAKILGIDEVYEGRPYVELSPRSIYVLRANKAIGDGMGMYLPDALDIARKYGATLEDLVPSDDKGETAMNVASDITPEAKAIGLKYKSAGRVELPIDIDAIASITSIGKGVLMGHRFDYDEWTDFPTINPNSKKSCGHGVPAIDNVLLKGKKYIVMDDSWGPKYAKFGQRYLSQEWLKARCFYVGYTMNFYYEEKPNDLKKPVHLFKFTMRRGDKNSEIVFLQDVLKWEGVFPLNVESTGLFGPATERGVKKLQEKYSSEILAPLGLKVGTGLVGASTLKWLQKNYA